MPDIGYFFFPYIELVSMYTIPNIWSQPKLTVITSQLYVFPQKRPDSMQVFHNKNRLDYIHEKTADASNYSLTVAK